MLTDEQKQIVVKSWRLVLPIAETASDLFYKRLFELRPKYRQYFTDDMKSQKRKLMQMLAFIVKSISWPDSAWKDDVDVEDDLMLIVLALGRRHRDLYRIPDDAYPPVKESLLWALNYGLGGAFNREVQEAWSEMYDLLATTMRMGAVLVDAEALQARPIEAPPPLDEVNAEE